MKKQVVYEDKWRHGRVVMLVCMEMPPRKIGSDDDRSLGTWYRLWLHNIALDPWQDTKMTPEYWHHSYVTLEAACPVKFLKLVRLNYFEGIRTLMEIFPYAGHLVTGQLTNYALIAASTFNLNTFLIYPDIAAFSGHNTLTWLHISNIHMHLVINWWIEKIYQERN